MSALSTITKINLASLRYTPALIGGVLAAEAAKAATPTTGQEAQHAVVSSVLTGIQVASGDLTQDPNPTVAGAASLVNLIVSVFNLLVFKKAPVATPAKP